MIHYFRPFQVYIATKLTTRFLISIRLNKQNIDTIMMNYQAHNDKSLIDLIQCGDKEAFNMLYHRHFPAVYKRVRYTIPDSDVDDVTQDIFIAVMRSITSFEGRAKFSTWLRTLINRQVADYYRRRERKVEETDLHNFELPSQGDSVGSRQHDERITLHRALKELPVNYQEVILLRFAEGLRFKEIANVLDKNPEAVKSLFRRAITALKTILEKEYEA